MKKVLFVLAILVVASAVYIAQRSDPEPSNDQFQNTEANMAAPDADQEPAEEDGLTGGHALDAVTDALGQKASEAGQALAGAAEEAADALGRAGEAAANALTDAADALGGQGDTEGGGHGE